MTRTTDTTENLAASVAAYLTVALQGVLTGKSIGEALDAATETTGAIDRVRNAANAYLVDAFGKVEGAENTVRRAIAEATQAER